MLFTEIHGRPKKDKKINWEFAHLGWSTHSVFIGGSYG